jgi:hypothetical protein
MEELLAFSHDEVGGLLAELTACSAEGNHFRSVDTESCTRNGCVFRGSSQRFVECL